VRWQVAHDLIDNVRFLPVVGGAEYADDGRSLSGRDDTRARGTADPESQMMDTVCHVAMAPRCR